MKNAIPKSVKICAHWHSVEVRKTLKHKGEAATGHIDHSTNKIRLSSRPSRSILTETLWHEILHSIAEQMGIGIEEGTVQALAIGVFQVLCDNPEMRRGALYTHGAPDC